MMTMTRLARALGAIGRAPEIGRCFARFGSPVAVTRAYLQLGSLDYPFELVYRERWRMTVHDWEDLTTAWVVLLGKEYDVRPDDRVIVDLGANFGAFCALCAAEAPTATVLAVEPFPATHERLGRFVERNGLRERVTTYQGALSDRSGTVSFDADPATPNHSRQMLPADGRDSKSAMHVTVETLDLDTLFERFALEHVDLLKIDIEGAEYPMLLAAGAETLSRVDRIGLEYHVHGHEKLTRHLAGAGFGITRHLKATGGYGIIEYSRTARRAPS